MQLPVTSKRAISVDELYPRIDTRTSLTRKAESIPSRLMLQCRIWFGLTCIGYLFGFVERCSVASDSVEVCPEDTHGGAILSDAKENVGCNQPDISRRHLQEANELQLEDFYVSIFDEGGDAEEDINDDSCNHHCFYGSYKSSSSILKSIVDGSKSEEEEDDVIQIDEKKDDDSATPINPRRWRRVLIVDDVPMNCKMLRRLFSNRFEECKEAENGKAAVDMVREAMASGVSFDVITMDYQMPVMDGVTATRCIRKLGYKGLIVAVTGNALSEDVNAFLSNGADIVLTKPLSIAVFDEYLNNAV